MLLIINHILYFIYSRALLKSCDKACHKLSQIVTNSPTDYFFVTNYPLFVTKSGLLSHDVTRTFVDNQLLRGKNEVCDICDSPKYTPHSPDCFPPFSLNFPLKKWIYPQFRCSYPQFCVSLQPDNS